MNALVLTLYALLMGIGLLSIGFTYQQWKKNQRPFYSHFFYYILFSFIFGFLNYFGRFIAKNILIEQGLSEFTRNVMDSLLNGLALPFCLIGLYFFIIFIRELLEQKKSNQIRKILIVIGILMMVFLTVDYIEYLSSAGESISDFIKISLAVINSIYVLINYLAILQIIFYRSKIKEKAKRKSLIQFALLTIILDSIYYLFIYKLLARDFFYYIVPSVFFLSPFIQFVFIKSSLARFYIHHPLLVGSKRDLSEIFKAQNITERETKIIELIRLGKSNQEIHETLYLSLQTVKNYISNIYQKLTVKNRVELINLINRLAADGDEND